MQIINLSFLVLRAGNQTDNICGSWAIFIKCEANVKKAGEKKKAKTNQQCTLTETCFSHLNCAVKVIFIIHTPSVIVAEMGDWSALFPFLVLSFIFHGFSVLPIATDDIGFIALFSLH